MPSPKKNKEKREKTKSGTSSLSSTSPPKLVKKRKKPEFVLGGNEHIDIPQYNSFRDKNLEGYFKSRTIKSFLVKTCLVDKQTGKPLDPDVSRRTIKIIEEEFQKLDKQKEWIEQEQKLEMKKQLMKRQLEDEQTRKKEKVAKIKGEAPSRIERSDSSQSLREIIPKKSSRTSSAASNTMALLSSSPNERLQTSASGSRKPEVSPPQNKSSLSVNNRYSVASNDSLNISTSSVSKERESVSSVPKESTSSPIVSRSRKSSLSQTPEKQPNVESKPKKSAEITPLKEMGEKQTPSKVETVSSSNMEQLAPAESKIEEDVVLTTEDDAPTSNIASVDSQKPTQVKIATEKTASEQPEEETIIQEKPKTPTQPGKNSSAPPTTASEPLPQVEKASQKEQNTAVVTLLAGTDAPKLDQETKQDTSVPASTDVLTSTPNTANTVEQPKTQPLTSETALLDQKPPEEQKPPTKPQGNQSVALEQISPEAKAEQTMVQPSAQTQHPKEENVGTQSAVSNEVAPVAQHTTSTNSQEPHNTSQPIDPSIVEYEETFDYYETEAPVEGHESVSTEVHHDVYQPEVVQSGELQQPVHQEPEYHQDYEQFDHTETQDTHIDYTAENATYQQEDNSHPAFTQPEQTVEYQEDVSEPYVQPDPSFVATAEVAEQHTEYPQTEQVNSEEAGTYEYYDQHQETTYQDPGQEVHQDASQYNNAEGYYQYTEEQPQTTTLHQDPAAQETQPAYDYSGGDYGHYTQDGSSANHEADPSQYHNPETTYQPEHQEGYEQYDYSQQQAGENQQEYYQYEQQPAEGGSYDYNQNYEGYNNNGESTGEMYNNNYENYSGAENPEANYQGYEYQQQ